MEKKTLWWVHCIVHRIAVLHTCYTHSFVAGFLVYPNMVGKIIYQFEFQISNSCSNDKLLFYCLFIEFAEWPDCLNILKALKWVSDILVWMWVVCGIWNFTKWSVYVNNFIYVTGENETMFEVRFNGNRHRITSNNCYYSTFSIASSNV